MVACKAVGEFKRNQEKIKTFCLEEKANKAREEEEKAILARTKNPLQPTTTKQSNTINRNQMGHEEVVPLARGRRNKRSSQQEQKRPRITRQARPQSKTKSTMRPTSPGQTPV